MNDSPAIREAVHEAIRRVIRDGGRDVEKIDDPDALREALRLDSLDLAVIVVRLEEELDIDPFRKRQRPIRTVGELVAVYEEAMQVEP